MLDIERLHISNVTADDKIETKEFTKESVFNFTDLPLEISCHIASYMSPTDLFSLFTVTKASLTILRSSRLEQFWKSIGDRYFAPNQTKWLGKSYKSRIIQASR